MISAIPTPPKSGTLVALRVVDRKEAAMDTLVTIVSAIGLMIVMSPLLMLLLTAFVLVPLALLAPRAVSVARTSFKCPVTRREVSAGFVTAPGADHPTDVVTCSMFPDGRVKCAKGCLEHAHTEWEPSPMTPRFALIADGTAVTRGKA